MSAAHLALRAGNADGSEAHPRSSFRKLRTFPKRLLHANQALKVDSAPLSSLPDPYATALVHQKKAERAAALRFAVWHLESTSRCRQSGSSVDHRRIRTYTVVLSTIDTKHPAKHHRSRFVPTSLRRIRGKHTKPASSIPEASLSRRRTAAAEDEEVVEAIAIDQTGECGRRSHRDGRTALSTSFGCQNIPR